MTRLPMAVESDPSSAGDLVTTGRTRAQTLSDARRQLRRGVLGTVVFATALYVYTLVQDAAAPIYSVETRWDAAIPLLPAAIYFYWMFFPFVVVAAFVSRSEDFLRIAVGALLAATIGWVCFLLFPASLVRPDLATLEPGPTRSLFSLLHWIDDSHNTFPSLHVSTTWICLFAFWRKRYRWLAAATALAIVLSTMFVKQHTLLDVAGGTVLAILVVPAASAASAWLCRIFPKL